MPTSRLKAFAYVNAEKAPVYRAIMRAFVDARSRFVLHLRPREIVAAMESAAGLQEDELDSVLLQLCEWGNLERHPDTAEVDTVEDFYRHRFLYQLTPAGEAAEHALERFFEMLHQPGELKTAALNDIQALLEELDQLAADDELDDGKVHRTLLSLIDRFEALTSKAQTFIAGLQRTIDLQNVEIETFLAYKEMLIDYLERFIGELAMASNKIATALRRLEKHGVEPLLEAAGRRDTVDVLDLGETERRAAVERWHLRWQGLRGWFLVPSGTSQAEILRSRARAAIPDLLAAVAGIHDRRMTKSDRASDLKTLARWFAELDDDGDAHRLWRAAFGLAPARHLSIDQETLAARDLEPVSAQTSWLAAPPLLISPRLRQSGRYTRRGRPPAIIDRGKEKRHLAELAAAEAEQIAAARQCLATGERTRLSEIAELDADTFQLFLDLLGEALVVKVGEGPVEATSSDGALEVLLEPTGDGKIARIRTTAGLFSGPDHYVTIRETHAG